MSQTQVMSTGSRAIHAAAWSWDEQAALRMLSDPVSRAIVASTIHSAKSITEISEENGIPESSCYRKVNELLEQKLMLVERIVVTKEGTRYSTYRAAISGMSVSFDSGELRVSAVLNPDVADKLHSMWMMERFAPSR